MGSLSTRAKAKAGTTTRDLRRASASTVLEALWRPGPRTGSDLVQDTGLNRATVHEVCADLIALGWVEELEDQRSHGGYSRGRPARRYALRARAGVAVGVEASTSRCIAIVTDLLGRPLGRGEQMAPPDPASRRESAAAAIREALHAAGATVADVFACTVALPAPIAASGRLEIRSNPFWALMDADLAGHLSRLLPCPVKVANDADLAALAEGRLGAARGFSHHITLLVDAGFGAGVFAEGSLIRGRWGRGGEMRWMDLGSEVGAPIGLGPLLAYWAEHGADATPPSGAYNEASTRSRSLAQDLDRARRVLSAAAAGETKSRAIARRAGRHLARVIATTAGVLDPELVVLAGRLAPDLEPVTETVRRLLPTYLDEPVPLLVLSSLGPDVAALGAVECSLDDVHLVAHDLRSTLSLRTAPDATGDGTITVPAPDLAVADEKRSSIS